MTRRTPIMLSAKLLREARAQRKEGDAEDWLALPFVERAARRRSWAKRAGVIAIIAARRKAELAPHLISWEDFRQLPLRERKRIRIITVRQEGADAHKAGARKKEKQIQAAIVALFDAYPRLKKWSTKDIAEKLWTRTQAGGWQERLFPSGIPYTSKSTFLQKVRLACAEIRPKWIRTRPAPDS